MLASMIFPLVQLIILGNAFGGKIHDARIAIVDQDGGPQALRIWLGPGFAENSSAAMRWLAAGIFVNCLAQMPFNLIQGAGRPDITAKLVLVQLPLYLLGLRFLVKAHGIEGASIAMAGRVTLEAITLFLYASRFLPRVSRFLSKIGTIVATALLAFYLATLPQSLTMKAVFLSLSLLAFGFVTWFWILAPDERSFLLPMRRDVSVTLRDL